MGFSIFSSAKTWESTNSKRLTRREAQTEEEAREIALELLQQGHDINGIVSYDKLNKSQQQHEAPRTYGRGSRKG